MRWAIIFSFRQISAPAVRGTDWLEERADGSRNMRRPACFQFPGRHIGADRADDVAAPVSDAAQPEHPSIVRLEAAGRTH